MILHVCVECNSDFKPTQKELARGNGKFCSLTCSARFNGRLKKEAKMPNCQCAQCGKSFYKSSSKRKASKSGMFFCTRACKDSAQRVGGIMEIQPDHYGTTGHYRVIALKHYPAVCEVCGYNRHPEVLHIHHRDTNHSNNELSNLAVVCPTCHEEYHFLSKTGKWYRS